MARYWLYILTDDDGGPVRIDSDSDGIFKSQVACLRYANRYYPGLDVRIGNEKGLYTTWHADEIRAKLAKTGKGKNPLLAKKSRSKNPLARDIVLRAGNLVATIGNLGNRHFLVLKERGSRAPMFDQYMSMTGIIDKLRGLGFDVSRLRAENPARFTKRQLDTLRGEWSKVKSIDPDSPKAQEFMDKMNGYSDDILKQLIQEKIPFVSLFANSIMVQRNFNKQKTRAKNPVPEGMTSKLRKATRLYEDFRDKPGNEILELDLPDLRAGLVIGRLSAVEYDTVRGTQREDYRHQFRKASQPLLCVTADGKTLFTVLGNFEFTERGIVDK